MTVAFDEYNRDGAGVHVQVFHLGSPSSVRVYWALEATEADLSGVLFDVHRSESDAFDDFEVVEQDRAYSANHEIVDTTVPPHGLTRKFYYRVRAHRAADGVDVYSAAATWFGLPDNQAQYIIEQQSCLIREHTGVPFLYWKRRTSGARCGECWDPVRQRVKGRCDFCGSTGFATAYADPQVTWLDTNVTQEMKTHSGLLQVDSGQRVVWLMMLPMVTVGDLLYEVQAGKRYRVAKREIAAQMRGTPIQQVLVLEELQASMTQAQLRVDEDLARVAMDDLLAEREIVQW